jgi:hypothetical protein
MANAHKLLEDALALSEEEREQLAWTLLDSLHDAHEAPARPVPGAMRSGAGSPTTAQTVPTDARGRKSTPR